MVEKVAEPEQKAFDGSPMPTQKLPTITKTEMALLEAMEDFEPIHPPTQTCIYGNVGTGKTIAGMEMLWEVTDPELYILYVYTANGWTSINNHPKYWGRIGNNRRIKKMRYESQEQLIILAKALANAKPGTPFAKIGGVMFDEFSHMVAKDQQWIVDTRVAQAEKDGKFKDPFVPALPDYLGSMRRTIDILDHFTTLDLHLMFISHERVHDKTQQIVPDFGDKTAKEFFRVLHSVYFADAKSKDGEYVRKLKLRQERKYLAKNRIGGLGSEATIDEIIEAYRKWGLEEPNQKVKVEKVVKATEQANELAETLTTENIDQLLED